MLSLKRGRVTFKKATKESFIFAAEFPPASFQTSGFCLAASAKSNQQEHLCGLWSQIKSHFNHHVILFLKPPRVRINWFPLMVCFASENNILVCFTESYVLPWNMPSLMVTGWNDNPEVRNKNSYTLFGTLHNELCPLINFEWNFIWVFEKSLVLWNTLVCVLGLAGTAGTAALLSSASSQLSCSSR